MIGFIRQPSQVLVPSEILSTAVVLRHQRMTSYVMHMRAAHESSNVAIQELTSAHGFADIVLERELLPPSATRHHSTPSLSVAATYPPAGPALAARQWDPGANPFVNDRMSWWWPVSARSSREKSVLSSSTPGCLQGSRPTSGPVKLTAKQHSETP